MSDQIKEFMSVQEINDHNRKALALLAEDYKRDVANHFGLPRRLLPRDDLSHLVKEPAKDYKQ